MEDGFRQEVKYIPLDQLDTSPRYQRDRTRGSLEKQIEDIANNFRPELFQIPDVYAKNGSGKYPVADGAGRIGGLRLLGVHGTMCRIIPDAPERKQSQTFVDLQRERRRLSSLDGFIGDLSDPTAKSIKLILRESGLALHNPVNGRESYPRLSGGVETMFTIFGMPRGDDRLKRTLRLAEAWAMHRKINGVLMHTLLLLVTGQTELEIKVRTTLERVSFAEARNEVYSEVGKIKTLHLAPLVAKYVARKHNARKSVGRVELDLIDKNQDEFLKARVSGK